MIKKIVYIRYLPIDDKAYNDLYIDLFLRTGFNVEYWDITKLYISNHIVDKEYPQFVTVINSNNQLIELLKVKVNSETVFITDITYRGAVVGLFKILTKFNCYLIYFSKSPLVPLTIKSQSTDEILFRIKTLILKLFNFQELVRYIGDIYSIYAKSIGIVKTYDLVFSIGNYGIRTIGKGWKYDELKSCIVKINSPDFDIYVNYNVKKHEKDYFVFLDQYIPFHPDFMVTKQARVSSEIYYESLTLYFAYLERKFNIKVIIAAHPRADNYKSKSYYKCHNVVFNNTIELVENAKAVLAHNSTAISFAVLYEKPLVLLTCEQFKKIMPGTHSSIMSIASELNCSVVNIDNLFLFQEVSYKYSKNSYNSYRYNYLTSKESENTNSKEIILNTFQKL